MVMILFVDNHKENRVAAFNQFAKLTGVFGLYVANFECAEKIAQGRHSQGLSVDLLVTDVSLPMKEADMEATEDAGIELVRRAKVLHPQLSHIFTYDTNSLSDAAGNFVRENNSAYFHKPFDWDDMLGVVRDLLRLEAPAAPAARATSAGPPVPVHS